MTPLAREVRRARVAKQRLQMERNLEAMSEEQKRQDSLRSGPKMERIRGRSNKMLSNPAEGNKLEGGEGLNAVSFASDRAQELAYEFGLGAADFRGKAHTGTKGFTAGDVRTINEKPEGEEE